MRLGEDAAFEQVVGGFVALASAWSSRPPIWPAKAQHMTAAITVAITTEAADARAIVDDGEANQATAGVDIPRYQDDHDCERQGMHVKAAPEPTFPREWPRPAEREAYARHRSGPNPRTKKAMAVLERPMGTEAGPRRTRGRVQIAEAEDQA